MEYWKTVERSLFHSVFLAEIQKKKIVSSLLFFISRMTEGKKLEKNVFAKFFFVPVNSTRDISGTARSVNRRVFLAAQKDTLCRTLKA